MVHSRIHQKAGPVVSPLLSCVVTPHKCPPHNPVCYWLYHVSVLLKEFHCISFINLYMCAISACFIQRELSYSPLMHVMSVLQ